MLYILYMPTFTARVYVNRVHISWEWVNPDGTNPLGYDQHYMILNYDLEATGNSTMQTRYIYFQTGETSGSYDIYDLLPATRYRIIGSQQSLKESGVNQDGSVIYDRIVNTFTGTTVLSPAVAPDAPSIVPNSFIQDFNSIALKVSGFNSVDYPDYNNGGSEIQSVSITYSTNSQDNIVDSSTFGTVEFPVSQDEYYILNGLMPNTEYEISAYVNHNLPSVSTPSVYVFTTTAIEPVRDINADSTITDDGSESRINITWYRPVNSYVTDVTGYKILYKPLVESVWQEQSVLDPDANLYTLYKAGFVYDETGQNILERPNEPSLPIIADRGPLKSYTLEAETHNIVKGIVYEYKVIAYNDVIDGISDVTNRFYGYAQATQPTNVTVEPTEIDRVTHLQSGGLKVSWDPPANGNFLITKYTVKWYDALDNYLSSDVVTNPYQDTTNEYTIRGLNNGVGYKITVTATTETPEHDVVPDNGLYTPVPFIELLGIESIKTIIYYPYNRPADIKNLTCFTLDRQLDISWTQINAAELGGFAFEKYEILIKDDVSLVERVIIEPDINVGNVNVTDLVVSETPLENGKVYNVSIRAFTTNLNTENVVVVSVNSDVLPRIPYTNPSVPTNVAIIRLDSSLEVTWDVPIDNGGYDIKNYYVMYKETAFVGEMTINSILGPNTRSDLIQGLRNGISYDISVFAVSNVDLDEPWNNDSGLAKPDPAIDGQGRDTSAAAPATEILRSPYKAAGTPTVTASARDLDTESPLNERLIVSFAPPSDTGGFTILGHLLKIYDDVMVEVSQQYISMPSLSTTFANLNNGVNYTITCKTVTDPWFNSVDIDDNVIQEITIANVEDQILRLSSSLLAAEVTEIPYRHPNPVNFQVTNVIRSDSKLTVFFNKVSNVPASNGGYDITSYIICVKPSLDIEFDFVGGNKQTVGPDYVDGSFIEFNTLLNGTEYDVAVKVVCDEPELNSNNSTVSSTISNQIPYKKAAAPEYLSVTPENVSNTNGRQLMARWGAPVSTGGFPIHTYHIYVNEVFYQETVIPEFLINGPTAPVVGGLINGQVTAIKVYSVTIPQDQNNNIADSVHNNSDYNTKHYEGDFITTSAIPYAMTTEVTNVVPITYDKKITINWNLPNNNGGLDISYYKVEIGMIQYSINGIALPYFTQIRNDDGILIDNKYTFNVDASETTLTLFETNTTIDGVTLTLVNGTNYDVRITPVTTTTNQLHIDGEIDGTPYNISGQQVEPYGKPSGLEVVVISARTFRVKVYTNGKRLESALVYLPLASGFVENPADTYVQYLAAADGLFIPYYFSDYSGANDINVEYEQFDITTSYDLLQTSENGDEQAYLVVCTNTAGASWRSNFQ